MCGIRAYISSIEVYIRERARLFSSEPTRCGGATSEGQNDKGEEGVRCVHSTNQYPLVAACVPAVHNERNVSPTDPNPKDDIAAARTLDSRHMSADGRVFTPHLLRGSPCTRWRSRFAGRYFRSYENSPGRVRRIRGSLLSRGGEIIFSQCTVPPLHPPFFSF